MSDDRRVFIKSSRSDGSGGDCVECAREPDGAYVRDSKNPTGPELRFDHPAWRAFLTYTKSGALDH